MVVASESFVVAFPRLITGNLPKLLPSTSHGGWSFSVLCIVVLAGLFESTVVQSSPQREHNIMGIQK